VAIEPESRPQRCARLSLILAGVNAALVALVAVLGYLIISSSPRGKPPFAGAGSAAGLVFVLFSSCALLLAIAATGSWFAIAGWRGARRQQNDTYLTRNQVLLALHAAPPTLFALYHLVDLLFFWIRGWWPF